MKLVTAIGAFAAAMMVATTATVAKEEPSFTVPADYTFTFRGDCVDCIVDAEHPFGGPGGIGTATLSVQKYNLGAPLSATNFVSFSYSSEKLGLLVADAVDSLSGAFVTTDPAPAAIRLGFDVGLADYLFISRLDGTWGIQMDGGILDLGTNGIYQGRAADVPEPAAAALLAAGFLCLAVARRRDRRISTIRGTMPTADWRKNLSTFGFGMAAALAICTAGWSFKAQADYPDRPVRMIVPFAPGTSTGFIARMLAEAVGASWGQPVVIEHVPGAAGNIAVGRVAKSPPDGYTLVFSGDAALVVNISLFRQLPYDPLRDLVPITQIGITPNILVVNTGVPARSVAELVALARAQPGSLNFASAGNGTSQHLAIEMLKRSAALDLIHVPYKESYIPDLLGGHVKAAFANIVTALPLVRAGKLQGLAVSSERRAAAISELPTMAEAGAPGVVASAWFGVLAPTGTPATAVQRVHAELTRALARPEVRQNLTERGLDIVGSTPEQFAALMRAEITRMAGVIVAAGIPKVD